MDESSPPPPFSPLGPDGPQSFQPVVQGQAAIAGQSLASFNSPIQRFGPANIRAVEALPMQMPIGAGPQSPQPQLPGGGPRAAAAALVAGGVGGAGIGPGAGRGVPGPAPGVGGGSPGPVPGPGGAAPFPTFNVRMPEQLMVQQAAPPPQPTVPPQHGAPQQRLKQMSPNTIQQAQHIQAMRRAEMHKKQQREQQAQQQQRQFATAQAHMKQQYLRRGQGRPPPPGRPSSASQVATVHTFRLPDAIDAGGMSFPPVKDVGPTAGSEIAGGGLLPFSCHCSVPHGDAEPLFAPLLEQDSVRVLELYPGQPGDPVDCRLHVTNLREAASRYSALSYPWDGDSPDLADAQIRCNAKAINIKCNLHLALQRLRRRAAPVILWIDALCMNQQDNAERSNQVRLMSQLYRSAFQVFIWLGPEIATHFHAPTALSGLCSIVNAWRQAQQTTALPDVGYAVDIEQQDVMEETPEELPPLANPHTFRLFLRSWFHRAWVIQEAALARNARVLLGKYEMPWDLVGLGAAILRTNMEKINFQGIENCQTGILNAYFMYRISRCQRYFDRLEFTFHQLLKLTRGFLCKDPRDRIYGILAIPTTTEKTTAVGEENGPFVLPDYAKTTEEVYRDVAWKIINQTRSLDILSSVQHDVSREFESTWVPDWQAILTLTLSPWTPSVDFNPAPGRVLEILTGKTRDHRHLTIRGIVADQISWVSEPGLPPRGPGNVAPNVPPNQFLAKLATQPVDVAAEACMVLTAGKDWYGMPVQDRQMHQADFFKTMHESRRTLDAFWDMMYVRPPPQHPVPDPSKEQLMAFSRQVSQGDHARFQKAAESVADSRRRLTTISGRLGLGPLGAQVGDKVCVLFGASVPFVLRKLPNGFALIGECYVEKLMHGEATKDHGNEKSHEEWITLF